MFGAIDCQLDPGIEGDDGALRFFGSQPVPASRRLGFRAKLCFHPAQVEVVHRVPSPGAGELARAERVVAAMRASAGAAVAVDGRMIDRPVPLRAGRLTERSRPQRRTA